MAGTRVENAIHQLTDSVKEAGVESSSAQSAVGTMGIKGVLWNNIAQLTATTILSGAFLYLGREFIVQSRDKDIMFREELKAQRVSLGDEMKAQRMQQEARWEKTDITHGKAMEKMGSTIERAVTSMENVGEELKTAVTEMKAATNKIGRPPDSD